ncbi:MAG: 4Fe-4S binding protein [Desulfohalobiaceae bacterium]
MSEKESRNVLLIFNKDIMYKPIIFETIQKYPISFNVLEAKILPKQEGRLVLQLEGPGDELEKAVEYMQQRQVQVQVLSERIRRDFESCVHCGACTSVCKTDALYLDRSSMEVMFNPENCVVCGQCQIACPMRAISMASIDMDTAP